MSLPFPSPPPDKGWQYNEQTKVDTCVTSVVGIVRKIIIASKEGKYCTIDLIHVPNYAIGFFEGRDSFYTKSTWYVKIKYILE